MTATDLLLPSGTTLVVPTGDGAELAVIDLGTGPTVVLAHGWTEQREIWAPVTHRLLDAGHRVVLYDQRGHGSSTSGRDGSTVPRLGSDLAAVLGATDVRDAVLAGHSMGGMAVLSLAAHHPDVLAARACGLALVATGAGGLTRGWKRIDALLASCIGTRALARLFRSPLGLLLVRPTMGQTPSRDHLRLTRDLFVACPADTRQGWLEAMQTMDLHECLATIRVPTTVLVGARDRLTPPRLADVLADGIAGARLVHLAGAGHQLPLEAPDEVAGAIRALACGGTPDPG